MSLADFDNVVLQMMDDFGATQTYVMSSQEEYDTETGTVSSVTTSVPVRMILMDLTLQSNGLSLKYGTEILTGDKEAYVQPPVKNSGPALVITPGSDKLVVSGTTYTVVTFKEVNPTGTDPVLYTLYLRR